MPLPLLLRKADKPEYDFTTQAAGSGVSLWKANARPVFFDYSTQTLRHPQPMMGGLFAGLLRN